MSPSSDVEEFQLLNRLSSESAADEFDGDSYSYFAEYNRKSRLSTLPLFWPSYTNPPDHYLTTQRRCKESVTFGRGNPHNETVFIAASIYDPGGKLAGKDWGQAVIRLIELLGPDNVFLSLYENDPDPGADASLNALRNRVPCNNSIVSEHLPVEDLPHIRLPSGDNVIKRIAYLAEVRNRALEPIKTNTSTQFDKLLFLNDVIFDPIEAIQLLFSTNIDENSGRAQYSAACAVDFINPFKFYDTFATRDLEGFGIGVPLYPWFTDSGLALSRNDVFAQKDAVRVRSCWGGMVAFQAKWFQRDQVLVDHNFGNLLPLHFRYEEDTFWDASECCLIHADLTYVVHGGKSDSNDTGIFMNPYVRGAYDPTTLSWPPYTRRIERLYSPFQSFMSHLARLPTASPRRLRQPGQRVIQKIWEGEPSQSRWLSSKRSYREIG
ncbi:hypothetical protein EIK77_003086 [Talaromyces pinophilus]|nr:hypothetical protein EIK77_003086 [Talaromyces pinophilus]